MSAKIGFIVGGDWFKSKDVFPSRLDNKQIWVFIEERYRNYYTHRKIPLDELKDEFMSTPIYIVALDGVVEKYLPLLEREAFGFMHERTSGEYQYVIPARPDHSDLRLTCDCLLYLLVYWRKFKAYKKDLTEQRVTFGDFYHHKMVRSSVRVSSWFMEYLKRNGRRDTSKLSETYLPVGCMVLNGGFYSQVVASILADMYLAARLIVTNVMKRVLKHKEHGLREANKIDKDLIHELLGQKTEDDNGDQKCFSRFNFLTYDLPCTFDWVKWFRVAQDVLVDPSNEVISFKIREVSMGMVDRIYGLHGRSKWGPRSLRDDDYHIQIAVRDYLSPQTHLARSWIVILTLIHELAHFFDRFVHDEKPMFHYPHFFETFAWLFDIAIEEGILPLEFKNVDPFHANSMTELPRVFTSTLPSEQNYYLEDEEPSLKEIILEGKGIVWDGGLPHDFVPKIHARRDFAIHLVETIENVFFYGSWGPNLPLIPSLFYVKEWCKPENQSFSTSYEDHQWRSKRDQALANRAYFTGGGMGDGTDHRLSEWLKNEAEESVNLLKRHNIPTKKESKNFSDLLEESEKLLERSKKLRTTPSSPVTNE